MYGGNLLITKNGYVGKQSHCMGYPCYPYGGDGGSSGFGGSGGNGSSIYLWPTMMDGTFPVKEIIHCTRTNKVIPIN